MGRGGEDVMGKRGDNAMGRSEDDIGGKGGNVMGTDGAVSAVGIATLPERAENGAGDAEINCKDGEVGAANRNRDAGNAAARPTGGNGDLGDGEVRPGGHDGDVDAGASAGAAGATGGDEVRSGQFGLRSLLKRVAGSRLPFPATVMLAVVTVASLLLAAVFGAAWSGARANSTGESQVRTVSRNFLLALTNFNSHTVGTAFSRIESYATGQFGTQAHQFFGSAIRGQLESAAASSRGQVKHLYIQSMTGSAASVYAVVNQTYVNSHVRSPVSDELMLVLGLADTSHGWKVGKVTLLQSPAGFATP